MNDNIDKTNESMKIVNKTLSYIQVSGDNDKPNIILGKKDDPNKVLIDNDSISFMNNNNKNTYIQKNKLHSNNVEIENSLSMGNTSQFVWINRNNRTFKSYTH